MARSPDSQESVRGITAVRAISEQWFAAFETFTADIEEYVDRRWSTAAPLGLPSARQRVTQTTNVSR